MRSVPGFVLLSLALAPGCAPQERVEHRVKVHPVEGRLDVLGRPAGNAHVAFPHAAKDRLGGRCPVGIPGPAGTFQGPTYRSSGP